MANRSTTGILAAVVLLATSCALDAGTERSVETNPRHGSSSYADTIEAHDLATPVIVPPVSKPPTPAEDQWVVDGKLGSNNEYWGAVEFPYTNVTHHRTGRVRTSVDKGLKKLHVFAENVSGTPAADKELRVYLDHHRFAPIADFDQEGRAVSVEDRACGVDLTSGAVTEYYVEKTVVGGSVNKKWSPIPSAVPTPPPFVCRLHPNLCRGRGRPVGGFCKAKLGKVVPIPGTDGLRSIDAEFEINLPEVDPLLDANAAGVAGVGFAVATLRKNSSFPERLSTDPSPTNSDQVVDTDRALYQTILFGQPRGKQLKIMTWNVKRFTPFSHKAEAVLNPGAFDDTQVEPERIGKLLGGYDVVALQEAWDLPQVYKIWVEANKQQSELGLPPYYIYGPVDFSHTYVGGLTPSFDATQGGVWTLSPYPLSGGGVNHVYTPGEACRGEDCLKAKGVLWTRLALGAPVTACTSPFSPVAEASGNVCKTDGDLFVDVYNTHLNANEQACGSIAKRLALISLITAAGTGSGGVVGGAAGFLGALVLDNNFNCEAFPNSRSARRAQLIELNEFVEATAAKDRPSIILGDLNIDGKHLNFPQPKDPEVPTVLEDQPTEYFDALYYLGLAPIWDAQRNFPRDPLTPFPAPYGIDGVVDHADVSRPDRICGKADPICENYNLSVVGGLGFMGTFIGTEGGQKPPDWYPGSPVPLGLGNERFDYVLVRPPVMPSSPTFKNPAYMMAWKAPALPWEMVWPLEGGYPYTISKGEVPERLSDHKAVVASLELVRFVVPPAFHPDWSHDWEARVKSANSTEEDCAGCDLVDLRVAMYNGVDTQTGFSWVNNGGKDGAYKSECSDQDSVIFPKDACVFDWVESWSHSPKFNSINYAGARLHDHDSSPVWGGDDDYFATILPGKDPGMGIYWNKRTVFVRDLWNGSVVPINWKDAVVSNNAPIAFCGWGRSSTMCLEMKWTETPK